jgi:hypothetical protein
MHLLTTLTYLNTNITPCNLPPSQLAEAAFEAQLAAADTYNNTETGVDLRGVHKVRSMF